jgi:catechol 2,3-dioxygenase-like lactoylglutathione lyase family enzyme
MKTAGLVGQTVKVAAVMALLALPTVAAAQNRGGGPAPAGDVVGAGNYIHVVANLDRTIAFYRTVLGVEPNGSATARPYAANTPVATMYNTPGSKFRGATFNVPNSDLNLEFIDWEGNTAPAVTGRVFDPGSPMIVLQVRSIEAGIEAVKQHGGSFVTPNGEPVRFSSERFSPRRLMIVRDPDGYFVELIDPDESPAAPEPGNVVGATFRHTAVDANKAARFFKTAFGFDVTEAGDFTDDPILGGMMAMKTVFQRFGRATVPGSTLAIQFAQYDKLDGKPVEHGLPRPGTSMLRLRVRDLDASLAKAKAAGATVAPGNNPPVTLTNGRRMAVVVGPDGLLLQLAEAPK